MYYCFGCGTGGNVFTFLMEYENLTFPEALEQLAGRAGMTLPEKGNSEEDRRRRNTRERILEIYKLAANYYYTKLNSGRGEEAKKYLLQRALSEETIRRFGLGYSDKFSDDLYQYMKKKGFDDTILNQTGLFTFHEKKGVQYKFWRLMNGKAELLGKMVKEECGQWIIMLVVRIWEQALVFRICHWGLEWRWRSQSPPWRAMRH